MCTAVLKIGLILCDYRLSPNAEQQSQGLRLMTRSGVQNFLNAFIGEGDKALDTSYTCKTAHLPPHKLLTPTHQMVRFESLGIGDPDGSIHAHLQPFGTGELLNCLHQPFVYYLWDECPPIVPAACRKLHKECSPVALLCVCS
jgi:hypothetical protein